MAQTYTIGQAGITFASSKSMLSVMNASGSGRIVRVYRIWILNNQVTSVTGVLCTFAIKRITATSGGSAVTPIKHDTTNESFPAQVTAQSGATETYSDIFRTLLYSNDEAAVGTGTWDEFETLPALMCVWDAGYGDSNIQPIVCREGQGLAVQHTGASAVGNCDVYMEVTLASS